MHNNERVLITGSNTGLGKELAFVFASNQKDIIIHGINSEGFSEIREKITGFGVRCDTIDGDLRRNDTIDRLYMLASKNNISVLINNAGLHCPHQPLETLNDKQIEDIIITNLLVPIFLTKRIYPLFIEQGFGTVININSLSGLKCQKLRSIYCASKWGLKGFSDAFRLESEGHNVRVIEVYPGRIKTRPEFTDGMDPHKVAEEIYSAYENESVDDVKFEGNG